MWPGKVVLLFYFALVLEIESMYHLLALDSLYRPTQPQTDRVFPASVSQMLELKVSATTPSHGPC